jgi:hypothetical protein
MLYDIPTPTFASRVSDPQKLLQILISLVDASGPRYEVRIERKRYRVEQIIEKPCEATVQLSRGKKVHEVSR